MLKETRVFGYSEVQVVFAPIKNFDPTGSILIASPRRIVGAKILPDVATQNQAFNPKASAVKGS
jgi:hypothetical protein